MRINICLKALIAAASITLFAAVSFGQDAKPRETQQPPVNRPQDMRTTVLRQLGLSSEQILRIRRMTMERKPLLDGAQKRLRDANRLVDEAIYADQLNENQIQERLRESQVAQGEVTRIRFINELSVRRILTAEQLVRFRELRQKFQKMRGDETRPVIQNRQIPVSRPVRDIRQFRPAVRSVRQRPQL